MSGVLYNLYSSHVVTIVVTIVETTKAAQLFSVFINNQCNWGRLFIKVESRLNIIILCYFITSYMHINRKMVWEINKYTLGNENQHVMANDNIRIRIYNWLHIMDYWEINYIKKFN